MSRVGIISDIHYAGPLEKARGDDYEAAAVTNPFLRLVLRMHRHFIWLRHPLRKGYLLDKFLQQADSLDYLVSIGDYSCDSGFVGVSDAAARQSAEICLGKLRSRWPSQCRFVIGDHELGKRSFIGGRGGMRLASWRTATEALQLEPFWKLDIGQYTLLGITSSLIALPVFLHDTLPGEREMWENLRQSHMVAISDAFASAPASRKIILFCHDPSALPFLRAEPQVAERLDRVEHTIVGHLHTNLVMRASRFFAALPFFWLPGHSGRRMASALRKARDWGAFNVRLCPSLAGVELLKDGGWWVMEIDETGARPASFRFRPLPR